MLVLIAEFYLVDRVRLRHRLPGFSSAGIIPKSWRLIGRCCQVLHDGDAYRT